MLHRSPLFRLLVLAAVLAAPAQGSDLERIRAQGRLVMLCAPTQDNLFVSTNTEAGPMQRRGTSEHFRGIDVAILSAFAEHLGVELEIRPAVNEAGIPTFSRLVPELLAGEGDLIANAFSITPERGEVLDFTQPYFVIQPTAITRKDSKVRSWKDLERAVASTIPGSSFLEHLRKLRVKEENIRFVDYAFEAMEEVSEGLADVALDDYGPGTEGFFDVFDNLHRAFDLPFRDSYGIAVRKGSDLRPELDRFIAEIKEDGRLDQILRPMTAAK